MCTIGSNQPATVAGATASAVGGAPTVGGGMSRSLLTRPGNLRPGASGSATSGGAPATGGRPLPSYKNTLLTD